MTRTDYVYQLHPVMRLRLLDLRNDLRRESIPLELYEAARSPLRQRELWLQGRQKPGKKVTNADAWWSFHQFGCAVDLVFCTSPGAWSWEEPERGMWARYHELAKAHELTPLYNRNGDLIEMPHVQLRGVAIDALRRGEYPAGGDREWEDTIARFVHEWQAAFPAEPAPPIPHDRPAIAEAS